MTIRLTRLAIALLLILGAGSLSLAGTAHAAPDRLPANFFGMSTQELRPPQEYSTMKRGGVDSLRFGIAWNVVEPSPGRYDFATVDQFVERAAQAGLEAFPFIGATPTFYGVGCTPQSCYTSLPSQTAEQRAAWQSLLRQLARRYGPGGSFWAENPELPRRPIRRWQIWNETNFVFFTQPRSPRLYAELVKISDQALRSVDRGARVVLAGLFAHPKRSQGPEATSFLRSLYRVPGIKARFDAVALHPYANDASELRGDIRAIRRVMRQNGDARAGLYLTEIGWGSARDTGFERGRRGQVRELAQAYRILSRMQNEARIRRVYWFSWEDLPGSCNFCDSVGLWTDDATAPKRSWFRFVRFSGCFGRAATILGSDGRDRLVGTRGRDVIFGLGGNDRILGRGGRDLICGGTGRDRISAGGGRDRVAGEQGKDRLWLQAGRDAGFGGFATDLIAGSTGHDRLLGEGDNDRLLGAAGNDKLFGGNANDVLLGGKGNDRLRGNRGRDRLGPGSGRDSVRQ
jgi:hypothetical protein